MSERYDAKVSGHTCTRNMFAITSIFCALVGQHKTRKAFHWASFTCKLPQHGDRQSEERSDVMKMSPSLMKRRLARPSRGDCARARFCSFFFAVEQFSRRKSRIKSCITWNLGLFLAFC
jgi:hypothetical protein